MSAFYCLFHERVEDQEVVGFNLLEDGKMVCDEGMEEITEEEEWEKYEEIEWDDEEWDDEEWDEDFDWEDR